jgi:uncharacterized protein involved in outer membrane biogenesis
MQLSATLRRRLLVAATILIALIAVWAAIGYFLVPRLVRSLATARVRDHMHRELKLGEIHFNPFTLELEIADARLPDADGGPLLSFKRLLVNAELLPSLILRGGELKLLQVDGLHARAVIGKDGNLNLAALAQLAGPDKGDKSPARLRVKRLALTSGELDFSELDRSSPFQAQLLPIHFELTNFSTVDTHGNAYHFTARSAAGETLDWSGHVFVDPLRSSGEFHIGAIHATTIADYLGDALPLAITSGTLDLTGRYDLNAASQPLALTAEITELTVSGAAVRPRAATQDYVQIGQIKVSGARADLAKREAVVDHVAITGGHVSAWLSSSGALNLAELGGAPAALATPTPASSAAATAAPAWHYALPDISISGLSVEAQDRSVAPVAQLAVTDLSLKVTDFSSDAAQPLGVELAVHVGDEGLLTSSGQLLLKDASFKGKLGVTDLDLTPVQPYLQRDTDMTLLSGRLGAQLDVERSAKAVLTARGDVDVHELRTIDNFLHQDFVKWTRLKARGVDFRSDPQRLRVKELIATEPYARVIVGGDRTLNISHVLNPPGRAEAVAAAKGKPAPAPAGPVADIAIDVVRIEKASANYTDLWIKPNFAVGLLDLNGTVKGLSSRSDSRATVDLHGMVDRYAPAVISGQINPLAATVYSDLSMTFRNMDMTTITPYSGHFAGYQIRKGKMSVELNYKINDRKLDAEHHFVIDQLELGDRVESPDATSLPVRLAIALLKDRRGIIDLNLPVTGSLDDPQFRVGPLVWKAIVNLIAKAATAPFALIGSLFGGHDEQVNQISFATGTAALDAVSLQRLETLRKALVERPGLNLEVPAAWSPTLDRAAMLHNALEAQLAAVAAKAGPDRYHQLLAAWRADAGPTAALPPLAAAFEADRKRPTAATPSPETVGELEAALQARLVVSDDELAALGKARATAIQDALLTDGAVDPERIFVTNAPPAAADAQQLRLDLTLK